MRKIITYICVLGFLTVCLSSCYKMPDEDDFVCGQDMNNSGKAVSPSIRLEGGYDYTPPHLRNPGRY